MNRPSTRRRPRADAINLNLVPILDAMVTLIAFLLFSMSFLEIVSIETPFPFSSQKEMDEKLKTKPLQLTLTFRDFDVEVWSPFDSSVRKTFPNLMPGQPDIKMVHDYLVKTKQRFPQEKQIVIVPFGGANYDTLISVMDSVRLLDAGDPPVYSLDKVTGTEVLLKLLFPEIVFGNLLSEG